jgi:hypothetical protein
MLSHAQVAGFGAQLKRPGWTPIVGLDSKAFIQSLHEFPTSILTDGSEAGRATAIKHIRDMARNSGADKFFAVMPDFENLTSSQQRAVENLYFRKALVGVLDHDGTKFLSHITPNEDYYLGIPPSGDPLIPEERTIVVDPGRH